MSDTPQYTDWTPELEQDPDREWLEQEAAWSEAGRRPTVALVFRRIAPRLRPWPEGAPEERFVPPAGTKVKWKGTTYVVETGAPVRGDVNSGPWCVIVTNNWAARRFLPLDQIERIPTTRTIRVEGIPADLPNEAIQVSQRHPGGSNVHFTVPIPGARIIGEEQTDE